MPPRKISRLTKIKFSELSAVDRPANDHATLESAEMMKRYGFGTLPSPETFGDLPEDLQTPEAKPFLKRFVSYLFGKREVSTEERESLASEGKALPHGGYPIANVSDLKNAIQAFGRAKDPAATKAHIKRRAQALGRTDLIPDKWKADGDDLEEQWVAKIDGDKAKMGVELAELLNALDVSKNFPKQKGGGRRTVLPQTDADVAPPGAHPGKAGITTPSVPVKRPGVKPKKNNPVNAMSWSSKVQMMFPTLDLDKSFSTIGQLAQFVWQLTAMCKELSVEGAMEGDEEPVAKELESIRDELANALVDLCQHEVAEVKTGREVGQTTLPI